MLISSSSSEETLNSEFSNVVLARSEGGNSHPEMFLASEIRVDFRRYGPGDAQKSVLFSTLFVKVVFPDFWAWMYVMINLKYRYRLAGLWGLKNLSSLLSRSYSLCDQYIDKYHYFCNSDLRPI